MNVVDASAEQEVVVLIDLWCARGPPALAMIGIKVAPKA
jgi:hypothetical protein